MKYIVQLYVCLFKHFEDLNSNFNPRGRLPSPNDNSQNGGCPVKVSPIGGGPKMSGSFFSIEQTKIDP